MSENEEFEFRLRLEKEQAAQEPPRRTPLQMIGRQVGLTARAGIEGLAGIPLSITQPISQGAKWALGMPPGRTTEQMLSRGLTRLGLPEPETRMERAVQTATEFIPSGIAGGATLGPKVTVPLSNLGKHLMSRALKPTYEARQSGNAAVAIDTMLERGLNVTEGGTQKLRAEIDRLNDQIKNVISNSSEKIDKAAAGKGLNALVSKFKNQVNPDADINAIRRAWDEFKNHPIWKGTQEMTVQEAQQLKQGTYRQLRGKYGELSSADVEAQKALARGLKEGIEKAHPDVAKLNEQESKLIRTLSVAERGAWRELNRNPGGLAWLTHNPANWAAFMADKSSLFKSLVARMVYSGSGTIGAGVGATGGMSLYELHRLAQPEQER